MKTLPKPEKFVVKRSEWDRGRIGRIWSSKTGCGCIMGLYLRKAGVPEERLDRAIGPMSVASPCCGQEGYAVEGVLQKDQSHELWVHRAMDTNDDPMASGDDRESLLKDLFKGAGVYLTFTD